jgi:hypothetical protein
VSEGPFDDKPAPVNRCPPITLDGERAMAYLEFAGAAAELEGKFGAYQQAQEKYRVALAKFTKLAVGG